MCGIIGMKGRDEDAVRTAAKTFAYRGPDALGIYADDQVTLGHNRLAIIDLDARSTQPFFDPSGEVGIVYNGEIYNYLELKDELVATGRYVFRTASDTEVLLYAYKEWGKAMTRRLSGMFAFAIYDRSRGQVILATDHIAMKPLFIYHSAEAFFFASEMKGIAALAHAQGINLSFDREAFDRFHAIGYLPPPATLYRRVRRLPPRAWAIYDCATGTFTLESYEHPLPTADGLHLKELMEERINAHLVADVPVGVFFSGGTDSSLIVAALHARGADLEAFSVEIEGRPQDAAYFDTIAARLGVRAHRFGFGVEEFDAVYPEVASRIDEPLYDNSIFVTYFIAKQAAARVKVVLSGDGGDEFFSGYPHSIFLNRLSGWRLDRELTWLDRLYLALPPIRGKNRIFEPLFRWFAQPVSYYLLNISPAKDLLSRQQWEAGKRAIAEASDASERFDRDLFLPGDLLRKTDLATMYCSIEGRLPLLDPAIIAASEGFPLPKGKELKPVLKALLAEYLPRELVYRPKSGFHLPAALLFARSKYLRKDLDAALVMLKERNLLGGSKETDTEELITRYPSRAFALVSLHHAIRNMETATYAS